MPERHENVNRVGARSVQVAGAEDMDGMIVDVEIMDYPEGGEEPWDG